MTEVSAYQPFLDGIVSLLEESRRAAGRAVNSILTATYWEIGRRIVEEENADAARPTMAIN